jgi:hypothetical protein
VNLKQTPELAELMDETEVCTRPICVQPVKLATSSLVLVTIYCTKISLFGAVYLMLRYFTLV